MTSFLAGPLAKQIARAFKGRLLVGTLYRDAPSTLDAYGDPVNASGDFLDYTFTGMRESFDARYRAQALIPETDVKIMILIASLRPITTITQNDQASRISLLDRLSNVMFWYQVRRVLEIDPASATAILQCYQIPSPPAP
jgi:hypothetical protein